MTAQPDRATRLREALDRDGRPLRLVPSALRRPGPPHHRAPRPAGQGRPVVAGERGRGLLPLQPRAGHATPADWLAECGRRGWEPDVATVVRSLRALDRAIATRGGQRRARPYLAGQLRRLP
jgi:hypothetical protein